MSEERRLQKDSAGDRQINGDERALERQKKAQASLHGREKSLGDSAREAPKASGRTGDSEGRCGSQGERKPEAGRGEKGASIDTGASARLPKVLPKIPRKEAGDSHARERGRQDVRQVRPDVSEAGRCSAADTKCDSKDCKMKAAAATGKAGSDARVMCTAGKHEPRLATHWYRALSSALHAHRNHP